MVEQASSLIHFHFLQTGFTLKNRNQLKRFILKLIRKEGAELEALNYIFCSDEYLLQVNQQYLNHNTYTDIITFQLSALAEPILSDIYISVERVRENAGEFQTSFQTELHRVIFHGALHLCGYKDKNQAQRKLMRQKEEEYLNLYFVPRGTKR